MSNEKRSDSWIDKLDGLEAAPGEAPFDRMAAWDRLHQRLDKEKSKKSIIWYWAAACLFVACIILVLPKRTHKEDVPPPVSQIDVKDPDAQKEPVIVKNPAMTMAADTPVKRKTAPLRIKKSADITDVAVMLPPVITFIPRTDTIQSETTTVAAAPRKMRVVHINEVGGDVIGNAYVYPEHKQFKIAISGPAGFASQVVADKTSKTTLSPKN